ncbi:release factor glutamine methyltransferase [Treponema bryantii]|uniref:peptide chain release factor N(5)-glutamine methyltransferase n=1 Tax=Treponema bryantii TaxID=163 RepID=A0A1H9EHZ3_9SPIR|nr:peptide chain release factor N(5)-glutamine methyltransferase [Treponema bryantii]SEQ25291.1 release factor glutamine methyltransferase [Treponema bryantii]
MTLQNLKTQIIKELSQVSPSAKLDAEVLLIDSLGFSKTELLLKRDYEVPAEKEEWLRDAVARRATGLPIAYITGHKEFYGYDFIVTPDVLIPKPDTEILVERAVDVILSMMDARGENLLTVCDMCTGSGCIAVAVAKTLLEDERVPAEQLPKFTLADISEPALDIARRNVAALLGSGPDAALILSRFNFVRTNLFDAISEAIKYDVILSNPPYIPHTMVDELLQDGRSEPRLALDGDITIDGDRATNDSGEPADDGLAIIRNLIPQAAAHLAPRGSILMETGEYNAEATAAIAEAVGFNTEIHRDLEGQLRVVEFY